MRIDLTPNDRELIRRAIDTELMEQRNYLSNQAGMSDDEADEADRELKAIEKAYGNILAKLRFKDVHQSDQRPDRESQSDRTDDRG